MSLKKIIDNSFGIPLIVDPLSYQYFDSLLFNQSARVLNSCLVPEKTVTVPFMITAFNCGFNFEKYVLMARFTNITDDFFVEPFLAFKRNDMNIFYDIAGKGEWLEFFIENYDDTNNADFGNLAIFTEIESL
jgi:hypothetical protein